MTRTYALICGDHGLVQPPHQCVVVRILAGVVLAEIEIMMDDVYLREVERNRRSSLGLVALLIAIMVIAAAIAISL